MTRLMSSIPVVGWFMAALFSLLFAIPLYFLWNALAPTYFYFLPAIYLHFSFWTLVCLVWLLRLLLSFSPFNISVSTK